MKISQTGIDMIKSFEGFKISAYKEVPSDKYYTIGYRHCGPDVEANDMISEKQAEKYLFKDLEACESVINSSDWNVSLNQNKFDALTSFCYSLGTETIKKLSKEKDDESIVKTIKKYISADGKEIPELVSRRDQEARHYNKVIFKCPENLHSKSVYELAQDMLNEKFLNEEHIRFCLEKAVMDKVETEKKYINVDDKEPPEFNIQRNEEASENQEFIFKCPENLHSKSVYKLAQNVISGELEFQNDDHMKFCLENDYIAVKDKIAEIKRTNFKNNMKDLFKTGKKMMNAWKNLSGLYEAFKDKDFEKVVRLLKETIEKEIKPNDKQEENESKADTFGRVDRDELCPKCNPEKMKLEELVTATRKGDCNNGENRKLCLGEKYAPVQEKINKIYELCPKCKPEKMGLEELITATIEGDCNNGSNRRLCLGWMYDPVQKEVNRIYSQKSK